MRSPVMHLRSSVIDAVKNSKRGSRVAVRLKEARTTRMFISPEQFKLFTNNRAASALIQLSRLGHCDVVIEVEAIIEPARQACRVIPRML